MNYVTDRATDHTTDCIITTEQLTKKYKKKTSLLSTMFRFTSAKAVSMVFSVRMGLENLPR